MVRHLIVLVSKIFYQTVLIAGSMVVIQEEVDIQHVNQGQQPFWIIQPWRQISISEDGIHP
jgi:hypothetical protein